MPKSHVRSKRTQERRSQIYEQVGYADRLISLRAIVTDKDASGNDSFHETVNSLTPRARFVFFLSNRIKPACDPVTINNLTARVTVSINSYSQTISQRSYSACSARPAITPTSSCTLSRTQARALLAS